MLQGFFYGHFQLIILYVSPVFPSKILLCISEGTVQGICPGISKALTSEISPKIPKGIYPSVPSSFSWRIFPRNLSGINLHKPLRTRSGIALKVLSLGESLEISPVISLVIPARISQKIASRIFSEIFQKIFQVLLQKFNPKTFREMLYQLQWNPWFTNLLKFSRSFLIYL